MYELRMIKDRNKVLPHCLGKCLPQDHHGFAFVYRGVCWGGGKKPEVRAKHELEVWPQERFLCSDISSTFAQGRCSKSFGLQGIFPVLDGIGEVAKNTARVRSRLSEQLINCSLHSDNQAIRSLEAFPPSHVSSDLSVCFL